MQRLSWQKWMLMVEQTPRNKETRAETTPSCHGGDRSKVTFLLFKSPNEKYNSSNKEMLTISKKIGVGKQVAKMG